jgi:ATP-dependent Clp protease ATP-binding subunit ClpA
VAKSALLEIVGLQLELLAKRLAERKIGLEVTKEAKELLVERGFDPVYGARPLKRTIQRDVQNPLAMKILAGISGKGRLSRSASTRRASSSSGKKPGRTAGTCMPYLVEEKVFLQRHIDR